MTDINLTNERLTLDVSATDGTRRISGTCTMREGKVTELNGGISVGERYAGTASYSSIDGSASIGVNVTVKDDLAGSLALLTDTIERLESDDIEPGADEE